MAPTASLSKLLPALGNAMVVYHQGTAQHSERVGALARLIGVELKLPDREIEVLHWAGLLHDIGKLAVPDEILSKPGPLDDEEWIVVQRHPVVGAELLHAISVGLDPIAEAVRAHHERWDGGGYPDGRSGVDIPLAGRVVAVADVYDALTHPRSYRPSAYTTDTAIEHLTSGAGRLYDPDAVEAFCCSLARSERER